MGRNTKALIPALFISIISSFLTFYTISANGACVQPPSNMVSWWRAEGNANDSIGTNHGTLMNGTTFASGMVGQSFSFDGVNDYISVPDSSSLDVTNQFTLDAWIYTRGDAGGWPDKGIITKWDNNNGYIMGLTPVIGGWQLFCQFNALGEPWPTNQVFGGAITENAWHHVACTYDNNDLKIYVNGVLVGTTNVGSKSVVNTSASLEIGSEASSNSYFYGYIDEVEVFNRGLSQSEIQAIYNAGSDGKCTEQTAIPTYTEWGMIVFVVLSFIGGVHYLRKRRTV